MCFAFGNEGCGWLCQILCIAAKQSQSHGGEIKCIGKNNVEVVQLILFQVQVGLIDGEHRGGRRNKLWQAFGQCGLPVGNKRGLPRLFESLFLWWSVEGLRGGRDFYKMCRS